MSINNIPKIKIGNLEFYFIQGGMGVGISLSNLASSSANEGGAGIIAATGLGLLGNYSGSYEERNQNALRDEIRKARSKTNGVIGVNILHALSDYSTLVKTAVEENVDMIISGAGIPRDLPDYLNGKDIKLCPIVSSARVAEMICKSWYRRGRLPDVFIAEGPGSGGHQGYSEIELANPEFIKYGLEQRITEIIAFLNKEEATRKIPVIAAGGIFYGGDIKKYIDLGAAGVQMATRFVTTNECDANIKFKQTYLNCEKEDIIIIKSPVGMPGRAINNNFLRDVAAGKKTPIGCPYHCLNPCNPEKSPYCIARALIEAQRGNLEKGFAFAGSNAWRCKEIVSVHDLVNSLDNEARLGIKSE